MNYSINRQKSAIFVTMSALLWCAPSASARSHERVSEYVSAHEMDWTSIAGVPPAPDSTEYHQDIQSLLDWQQKRTPADCARCQLEASGDAFTVGAVLGNWFNKKSLPDTHKFFHQVTIDADLISESVKHHWKRPRPYVADARVHPCIKEENTTSFPSGHATRGMVWGIILAEMFPEHRTELLAQGKQFGDDRVVAGEHYPSDVAAGQKLGAAIAKKMLANPTFKKAMELAKDECLAKQ